MSAKPARTLSVMAWFIVTVIVAVLVAPQVAVAEDIPASVIVEQPTTTVAPTTTAPPTTTPPTTQAPITPQPTTTTTGVPQSPSTIPFDPAPATTTTTTPDSTVVIDEEPKTFRELVRPLTDAAGAVADGVKSTANATARITTDVLSGVPVAEAMEQALPEPVAAVVVPAVRTASKFSFPIGLAAAVMLFLVLQQRIDSNDPKLAAAPIAHDDDYVDFK